MGERGAGDYAAGIGLQLWAIFECQVASCHKVSEIQPKCQMSAKDIITGQLIRLPRLACPSPTPAPPPSPPSPFHAPSHRRLAGPQCRRRLPIIVLSCAASLSSPPALCLVYGLSPSAATASGCVHGGDNRYTHASPVCECVRVGVWREREVSQTERGSCTSETLSIQQALEHTRACIREGRGRERKRERKREG